MNKIKLICIPYAGGSMQVYKNWTNYLNDTIEFHPIELTGRGKRFSEPRYESMEAAVNDIYQIISPLIQNSEYAFFGHSMGSIIVYELYHRIIEEGDHNPKHVFFSGRYPPFLRKDMPDLHDAPLDVFIKEMREMGGTPDELLDNNDFIEFFIPILRADYKLIENHRCMQRDVKFGSDISVFNGMQDKDVNAHDLEMWKTCTFGRCDIYEFEGGHFFINERVEDIVNVVNNTLVPSGFETVVLSE